MVVDFAPLLAVERNLFNLSLQAETTFHQLKKFVEKL